MVMASNVKEARIMMPDTQIPGPVKVHLHTREAISLRGLRAQVKRADGINAKIAVFLTNVVGSMWCAYAFSVLALFGLPAALRPGGEGIIPWIAQTFLQLVLRLSLWLGRTCRARQAMCDRSTRMKTPFRFSIDSTYTPKVGSRIWPTESMS